MGRLEDGLGRVDVCHTVNVQDLKDVINDQNTHTCRGANTHKTSEIFVSPHGCDTVFSFSC